MKNTTKSIIDALIEETKKNISESTIRLLKCNDEIEARIIASTIRHWKAELEKMQNNSLLACK